MKLKKSFFTHDVVTEVARSLIGKKLCTQVNNEYSAGIIVETEAYSEVERACHAFNRRKTKRTETLFMEGGISYVYLCYGIHKLFNVVTNKSGVAEAVLVRAIEPVEGLDIMMERRGLATKDRQLTSGPGKLTQALGIDMEHDKQDLTQDTVWLEKGLIVKDDTIERSARIGVRYAEEDALLPWRFSIKNNSWVSSGDNKYNFK
ncbi:DNA-3-methyladenine glycosylase [Fulvivirga sediminis]|uniref:Putative 3-methyladenine DNA glycosylase n=1 Tax=Fulvivirga sediminis TaxID=2803949 RepID=A0A937K0H8_9BACT|nr:DNA-3-methyladenine glycosylase [Fulvivirga sediminis]MBL3658373.1 DNA-3-methyladenine glycosylase [Fulvivirga sediminis]